MKTRIFSLIWMLTFVVAMQAQTYSQLWKNVEQMEQKDMPDLDMISIGPTLRSPHSPDERCLIPTVSKFYDFLVATLANAPVKG